MCDQCFSLRPMSGVIFIFSLLVTSLTECAPQFYDGHSFSHQSLQSRRYRCIAHVGRRCDNWGWRDRMQHSVSSSIHGHEECCVVREGFIDSWNHVAYCRYIFRAVQMSFLIGAYLKVISLFLVQANMTRK